jgi:hypothetical protein
MRAREQSVTNRGQLLPSGSENRRDFASGEIAEVSAICCLAHHHVRCGPGGNQYSKLVMTGKVDQEWAKEFLLE